MSINILMPALSPTMTEGSLAKWLVKEGDDITPGDIIAEIETDKATMEVEAADQGTLGKIVVPEGTEAVPVNQIIGILLEAEEDINAIVTEVSVAESEESVSKPIISNDRVKVTPLAERIANQLGLDLSSIEGSGAQGKITKFDVEAEIDSGSMAFAGSKDDQTQSLLQTKGKDETNTRLFVSPLARSMAKQADIDVSSISGSGPEGRIIKRDITAAGNVVETELELAKTMLQDARNTSSAEVVKLSTMRKVIAERMTQSKGTVPHFYLTVDCEIDELLKVRGILNGVTEQIKISVNDFVIRACGIALKDIPQANVSYHNEDEMLQYSTSDISVAVAIEGGLITPIVREAEQKGLKQLSLEMSELATRARNGKLKPEEYKGGSFSISNLGMYGVKQFDAVINPPQACILAVGLGEQRPVVKNNEVVPATVMSCTLSVDHRVVDGAIGAELLGKIKQYLENPALMLL